MFSLFSSHLSTSIGKFQQPQCSSLVSVFKPIVGPLVVRGLFEGIDDIDLLNEIATIVKPLLFFSRDGLSCGDYKKQFGCASC
jgi:hypothetical protein